MGRIRTIKPEFPQSESIGKLSRDARLLFIQLWTIVDDAGRARASSRLLASLLYPYDDDAPALIGGWMDELHDSGSIVLYQVGGSNYLVIPTWLEHQKIDRPSPSKLPPFDSDSTIAREASREIDDSSTTDLGPVPRILGKEERANPIGFDALGASFDEPSKKSKLWKIGVPALQRLNGKPANAVRGFMGKCLKILKDEEVLLETILLAEADRPINPEAWILGALRHRAKTPAAQTRATAAGPSKRPGIWMDANARADAWAKVPGVTMDKVGDKVVPCIHGWVLPVVTDQMVDAAGFPCDLELEWTLPFEWLNDLLDTAPLIELLRKMSANAETAPTSWRYFDRAVRATSFPRLKLVHG